MLAGLLRAPSNYNPIADDVVADQRALLVLQNMVASDYLTPEEADKIASEGRSQSNVGIRPHRAAFRRLGDGPGVELCRLRRP